MVYWLNYGGVGPMFCSFSGFITYINIASQDNIVPVFPGWYRYCSCRRYPGFRNFSIHDFIPASLLQILQISFEFI